MSVELDEGSTVTYKQQTLIDLWDNPTKKTKEKAVAAYVKESAPLMKVFVCFSSAVIVASSATTGAAIGCVAGAGIGSMIEPGVGTRVGMYAGGALGGLAGGAIGTVMAKRTIMILIPRTKFFARWKRTAQRDKLYPLFEKILKENVFTSLTCPISLELPVVPVETPCGHIYEQEQIESWLNTRKKTDRYCTLGCQKPFTIYDLTYSEEHIRKIMHAANLRIQELDSQNDKNSKYLSTGLSAIVRDNCMISNKVLGEIMHDECRSAFDRNMDEERFLETAKKMYRKEKNLQSQKV
jgi:hypothetical protein